LKKLLLLALGILISAQAQAPRRATALVVKIQRPIVVNGKQMGTMKMPAGAKVSVVSELPDDYIHKL